MSYSIPENISIGHVHLKVSNIRQSLDFYCGLLGFDLISMHGDEAAFISGGGYHHHIGLNTWYSKNAVPPELHSTGLFHLALLYPTRYDLAVIYHRLLDQHYSIDGSADHGVSEAIYISDPDKNGVELYYDRPKSDWPRNPDNSIHLMTKPLDTESLLAEMHQS